jgi:hypothetical protein
MKPLTQFRQTTAMFLVMLALTCFWLGTSSKATDVIPVQGVDVIYSFAGDEDGERLFPKVVLSPSLLLRDSFSTARAFQNTPPAAPQ